MPADRVRRVAAPLRRQVSEMLQEDIAAGEWGPGDRLIERDLCERYGVSRTVIRESLRRVEADGLITMVPHKGPVVSRLSVAEVQALYEVRAALEGLAGGLFTRRASVEEREALVRAVDEVEVAMADGDIRRLLVSKDRFYDALLDGAGNQIIATTLRTLHARVRWMRSLSLTAPGRGAVTLAELRRIVQAVRDGDAEEARRACEQHVEAAASVALARLSLEAGGTA